MDEETLEALLAGSDGDISDAEDENDAGSDLEDLEGQQLYPHNASLIAFFLRTVKTDLMVLDYRPRCTSRRRRKT